MRHKAISINRRLSPGASFIMRISSGEKYTAAITPISSPMRDMGMPFIATRLFSVRSRYISTVFSPPLSS